MHALRTVLATLLTGATLSTAGLVQAADKPTVVLVHGAFAGSSSWNGVIRQLQADGYPVVAAANPLRSVNGDAQAIAAVVKSIPGPVILAGHSYGGNVIANVGNAANPATNLKALVFVAAFAPEQGESALQLSGKFPGSSLGPALADPVPLADGGKDLYVRQAAFHEQFAADVPSAAAALMAASQRPVAVAALEEVSGSPSWKRLPSWFIYGDADKNIPAATLNWMAERAASQHTVVIHGASHVPMVSHPAAVAALIEQAAQASQTTAAAR